MLKRQCFPTDIDTEAPALTTSQMREVDRGSYCHAGNGTESLSDDEECRPKSGGDGAGAPLRRLAKSESCCPSGDRRAGESGYRLRSISSGGDDSEFSKGLRSK